MYNLKVYLVSKKILNLVNFQLTIYLNVSVTIFLTIAQRVVFGIVLNDAQIVVFGSKLKLKLRGHHLALIL